MDQKLLKRNTHYLTENMVELLSLMSMNSTLTVFAATFSYFRTKTFLWNFFDFQVFVFGYTGNNLES